MEKETKGLWKPNIPLTEEALIRMKENLAKQPIYIEPAMPRYMLNTLEELRKRNNEINPDS